MLYHLFTLLVILLSYARAEMCDAAIFGKIAGCVSQQQVGVNIDVLGAFDGATFDAPLRPPSRVLCSGKTLKAALRFIPQTGDPLAEAAILWGDSPIPQPVNWLPCSSGVFGPKLAAIPHPPGSFCALVDHTYTVPGEYPAAVFASSQTGVETQVDGFLSVGRCRNSVNLDLIAMTTPSGSRTICAGQPAVASLRSLAADPTVAVSTFGQDGKIALWSGNLVGGAPDYTFIDLSTGPADIKQQVIVFPTPGSWPVALFAESNEDEVQLEAFVDVKDCSSK